MELWNTYHPIRTFNQGAFTILQIIAKLSYNIEEGQRHQQNNFNPDSNNYEYYCPK